MPELLFLLFLVAVMAGGKFVQKLRLLPPPKVDNGAPRLNLAASSTGTVIDGSMTSSPGQVACVAFGVVFGRIESQGDDDSEELVELHRGGWSEGFDVRTDDGGIISVPRGPIHVDGEWDEPRGLVDASSYLAAVDVPGDAAHAVLTSRARILEVHVRMNEDVIVQATRFDEARDAEPQQGHAYRQGLRKRIAQGDIFVRAIS